jgi:hypothetical protein
MNHKAPYIFLKSHPFLRLIPAYFTGLIISFFTDFNFCSYFGPLLIVISILLIYNLLYNTTNLYSESLRSLYIIFIILSTGLVNFSTLVPHLPRQHLSEKRLIAHVSLNSIIKKGRTSYYTIATVDSLYIQSKAIPCHFKIFLRLNTENQNIISSATLRTNLYLRESREPVLPADFSFHRYLRQQNVFYTAAISEENIVDCQALRG